MYEIKNAMYGINDRLGITEEKFSEFRDIEQETQPIETGVNDRNNAGI